MLGLPPSAVSFEQRGFRGASRSMTHRLEAVGSAFLTGYHFALESGSISELESKCSGVEPELRGFACEGAAMGLALLDRLTPWSAHGVEQFLAGSCERHAYMIHVGVGWVWARMPFGFRRRQEKMNPLLGWLAFDGWGFHEGFFHWPGYIAGQQAPMRLRGYERRVFDQGLGRSFWFVNGGNVELIGQTIANFPSVRQPDLWSGIGLAAGYAGIVSASSLQDLRDRSGPCRPQLAQGAAFAAKARQRAGNAAGHTRMAAEILCGMSADEAAQVTDTALEHLAADPETPAYETWRRRIQNRFQEHFSTRLQLQAAA